MIIKCCDCFCCCRWYCQGVANQDALGLDTCLAPSTLDLHWQVWKMDETKGMSKTTLLYSTKCKPMCGLVRCFIMTNCSANVLSLISYSSVTVANGSSSWSFATSFWELDGCWFRRCYLGLVSFFPIHLARLPWHKFLSLLGCLF